jgi:hypothetical protein
LVLVATACGGGGGGAATTTSGPTVTPSGTFLSYSNPAEGFTIGYPATWTRFDDVQGTVVLFKSPSEGPTDRVRESVGVSTESLPSTSFTIEAYTDAAMQQVQQTIPEFHLISSDFTTLAGHPAHEIVYTGTQGSTMLQWRQAFTVVSGKGYVLTFAGSPDDFARYDDIVQSIFDTFALT